MSRCNQCQRDPDEWDRHVRDLVAGRKRLERRIELLETSNERYRETFDSITKGMMEISTYESGKLNSRIDNARRVMREIAEEAGIAIPDAGKEPGG